jgi:3-oxoacyl-[acyl-carrier-protein] synthase-3
MLFKNVSIAGLAHVDAPHTLTSADINEQLKPTLQRLGIKTDVLGDIAGIHARRLWDDDQLASDVATLAARKALADAGVPAEKIGLLVNTSVSRDYLEPSTASIVSGNLGLGENCQNFDVANACLAFINGMDIAARMLERGEIDYALVVDGETANLAYKKTMERMTAPDVTEEQFRNELATLTLGCGAAAMVMSRAELTPDAPRYKAAKLALGWAVDELDQFVIHQVSQVHTAAFIKAFGIDPKKVLTIFGEHGNIGPASVPIVLSKLKELGRLKKGDRIALLGIGSGLNCSMAEVVW